MRTYFSAVLSARTGFEGTWLVFGLAFGLLWSVAVVVGYSVGIGLAAVWVGVPILAVTHAMLRPIASFERGMVNTMLEERIPAPTPLRVDEPKDTKHPHAARFARWAHALVHDRMSWGALAWVMIRMITGPIGFAIVVVAIVVPASLVFTLAAVIAYDTGVMVVSDVDPGVLSWTPWLYASLPALLIVTPALAWAVRGFAYLHRLMARWALGPCASDLAEEATARAQLAEEQVRIDQDLHDSIGHMITMNIVQAGAGAHVFDSDPEFARQALRNIEERGRAAMGELDRIIAAIRGDQAEPRAPLAGLTDIPVLVETARQAGMVVEVDSAAPEVPRAIGRAAFGIVREALTNAAKHAPGAPVTVCIALDSDALGVEVVNGAPGETLPELRHSPSTREPRGISGIRDRVGLLGGRTEVGPTPEGGYAVRALIPLDAALAAASAATCHSPWVGLREKVSA
jgi:signal transduction histidine kinase